MFASLFFRLIACVLLLCAAVQAHALTAEAARAMAAGDTDDRIAALQAAIATPDEATVAFIRAMADDAVKIAGDKAIVMKDGKGLDRADTEPADRRQRQRQGHDRAERGPGGGADDVRVGERVAQQRLEDRAGTRQAGSDHHRPDDPRQAKLQDDRLGR